MKALSLYQPHATAMAMGIKKVETRSWYTSYRGDLLIHAAKRFPEEYKQFAECEVALGRIPWHLPFGQLVAIVTVIDVRKTEELQYDISALERLYGDYSFGRFGFVTDNLRTFKEPIPYRGHQGFFEVDDHLLEGAL